MTSDGPDLDRRRFLKVGGLGAGLVAVAVACVNTPESEQITQTGTRIPAPSTSVPPDPGTPRLDAQMVLTALSVERLAVETYERVLRETWITDAPTVTVSRRVLENHKAHVTELTAQATALGQRPADAQPNATFKEETVDSELEAVAEAPDARERQISAVNALASIEDALAQLYAKAGGTMTTPELRRRIGSIGSATARQYTALAGPAGLALVPLAFLSTASAAIPEDAWVEVDDATLRTPGTTVAR